MPMIREVFIEKEAILGPDSGQTAVSSSGLSWSAIVAGAAAAAATSVILLALGAGLGLLSFPQWDSVVTFTIGAAIWLIMVQWISAGVGGYLAGRLRTRWLGTHAHEVFFRDTAQGFLSWSVAMLITLALAGMTAAGGFRGVISASRAMDPPGVASASKDPAFFAYDVDYLFRTSRADPLPSVVDARQQAGRILAAGMATNAVSPDDSVYLAQMVAQQADVSMDEAQNRVQTVVSREQDIRQKLIETADAARKAASALSIFTALSMLIGALIASVAAGLGGQQREQHP